MKKLLFLCIVMIQVVSHNPVKGQSLSRMPDSVRKAMDEYNGKNKKNDYQVSVKPTDENNNINTDDLIKEKLIKLGLSNAEMQAADASIRIAELNRKKANSTLLSSVNIGANANEFVVNNSPAANFFPKYNIGLSVPMDMFAKNKNEKKTADQIIIINKSQKEVLRANIRAKVLIQYEIYKEKKELVELQKIAMEDDIAAYERAQKDFKEDAITMEELNKIFKTSVAEKALLATKEKELNIALIQMEELIGVPLQKVLQN